MKASEITKENVENFFNKYKNNAEQIIRLERKVINESYSYEKWTELLDENSELTRQLFQENESLLDDYLRPAISDTSQLAPNTLNTFLRHILFFLFENNIDSFVAEELPRKIFAKPDFFSNLNLFEVCLSLGISNTLSCKETFEYTSNFFIRALEVFPNFEAAPDQDTMVHISFAYCYLFLAAVLYKSDNYSLFLSKYNEFFVNIMKADKTLYKKMWGENTDYEFHINLIFRHFRTMGIFACGRNNFKINNLSYNNRENQIACETIKEWLKEEYDAETQENLYNPMIWTYYQKLRFQNEEISREEYISLLSDKFQEIKNIPFEYPEASFPQDDDPVDPQFANVIDKMKITNKSTTTIFVLLPELFQICSDKKLKKEIIDMIIRYHSGSTYAAKGFGLDNFIISNIELLGPYFENLQEFNNFVHAIFIHRQISSAIHFSMVRSLAGVCLSHFLSIKPELFVIPGYIETANDVLSHRQKCLDFMQNGAFLHDIGKLAFTKIVNLHYRKITDYEFCQIKLHPLKGAEIASKIPFAKPYVDMIIGHHRWWNDAYGYPENFRNSSSPIKYYVALTELCDCIDTATDSKGRNYASIKSFDTVLTEITKQSGSRYSAELLSMISEDEALKEELRYLTSTGRNIISNRTYLEFIEPNTTFSEKDERYADLYTPDLKNSLIEFYKSCYPDASERYDSHISDLLQGRNSRFFVLRDSKSVIYGVIAGHILTSLETDNRDFIIDEIIVTPERRRKGCGTELLTKTSELLKAKKITRLVVNIEDEFSHGTFFWIKGFSPDKKQTMVKEI